jgi:hypothetical protein
LSYGNILCGNGLNILTDKNFQDHGNIYGKAFVLLMGLVGARLAMSQGADVMDLVIERDLPTKDLENNIHILAPRPVPGMDCARCHVRWESM